MDNVISIIVLIIVVCSIISGFSKKKPIQEQKQNNRPRTAVSQPSQAPVASAAMSSAVQSGEGEGKMSRGSGEGSSLSGEGRSQEQMRIKSDKVSSEGVSAYPIRRVSEPEEDAELNIAVRELFEHDNLVKGVIIAEVLGKPKALR